eukprot:232613-Prymnesium_polylepis.1
MSFFCRDGAYRNRRMFGKYSEWIPICTCLGVKAKSISRVRAATVGLASTGPVSAVSGSAASATAVSAAAEHSSSVGVVDKGCVAEATVAAGVDAGVQ